jgi:Protein of unknown function (DUF2971)
MWRSASEEMKPVMQRLQDALDRMHNPEPAPSLLHHYTGAIGFEGIFKSKQLWLSHSNYLNDTREFLFGRDGMMGRLQSAARDADHKKKKELAEFLYDRNHRRRIIFYVFSVSRNGDQLSQWRAYTDAGGAYSIGFRGEWLARVAQKHGGKLIKVHYGYPALHEPFDALFEECFNRWSVDNFSGNLDAVDGFFCSVLSEIAMFCKHDKFSEEEEWRLVIRMSPQTEELVEVRPRGPYLMPYIPVSFGDMLDCHPMEDLFDLKSGAGMDSSRALTGLDYLRKRYALPSFSSGGSGIPYRPEWSAS